MNRRKILLLPFLFFPVGLVQAQVNLDQFLIGTSGGHGTAGSVQVSWSTGESVITTAENTSLILTQGFHQPRVSESMSVFFRAYPSACPGSNSGAAAIIVSNGTGPFSYAWTPSVSTTDTASGLSPGDYSVVVSDAEGQMDTVQFTIQLTTDAGCEIHIYSGLTPNGDGRNDQWVIDNINTYPENSVSIFNRWGDRVWMRENYDNQNVIWSGENGKGGTLPEGTYFYIVTIPDKQFTGWVEITR